MNNSHHIGSVVSQKSYLLSLLIMQIEEIASFYTLGF